MSPNLDFLPSKYIHTVVSHHLLCKKPSCHHLSHLKDSIGLLSGLFPPSSPSDYFEHLRQKSGKMLFGHVTPPFKTFQWLLTSLRDSHFSNHTLPVAYKLSLLTLQLYFLLLSPTHCTLVILIICYTFHESLENNGWHRVVAQ